MSRVPIRVRVAVAFAVAMALVLAGAGILVYARLGDDLAHSLDQDLRLRAQDLSALLTDRRGSLAAESRSRLIEPGESFAQLIDARGRVLDGTRELRDHPLLGGASLGMALRRDHFVDRPSVPGLDEPARLLALPINRGHRPAVLVVGATLENRAEALRSLRTELLIAGPLALLLATIVGYLLAGTALRAVERMRARAAEISAERPGERLPVARTGDELQHLGQTLNEMLDRLERALERERGFVAEAGHELRTPLALLRAELDYALHYADSEEELRSALASASRETDRLTQLATDLLLIASADQGRLRLRLERLSIAEVLDSVRQRFAWRAEAEGRAVIVDAPGELTVDADRLRLEQALGNLLDNALRHGSGAVRLAAVATDRGIELHVRDEGEGFPAHFLPHAFERFGRADHSRGGDGAGLGLTIVETIARAHHGQAAASSLPTGGAEVTVILPPPGRRPATPAASGTSPAAVTAAGEPSRPRARRDRPAQARSQRPDRPSRR